MYASAHTIVQIALPGRACTLNCSLCTFTIAHAYARTCTHTHTHTQHTNTCYPLHA